MPQSCTPIEMTRSLMLHTGCEKNLLLLLEKRSWGGDYVITLDGLMFC